MATKPTPGASDGTYGTEMNAFLDISLDVNGFVINEALQTTSAAPVADAALANKKYVDDRVIADVAFICKAFGNITHPNTVSGGSQNISGVVDTATDGEYIISWDTNFASADYVIGVTPIDSNARIFRITAKAAGSVTLQFSTAGTTPTDVDVDAFDITAFGSQ
jgi:hypothetical protein